MKKYFLKSLAILVLFTLVSSCKKTEVTKEVFADSYINSIVGTNGTPVFAMIHSAYSFTKMTGVIVKGATGSTTTLQNFNGDGFAFYMDVADKSLYKAAIPSAESFTYNVTYSDGTTATKVNSVAAKSILPAQQMVLSKDAINITLKWQAVVNCEAYKVSISRVDSVFSTSLKVNTLIYQSSYLVPKDATTDLSIPFAITSFPPSDSYTDRKLVGFKFDVAAFIFEQGQDSFEAVSTASKIADISKL
ncbi:MAG: hypothetical protein WCI31_10855 [Prolixibacteraceae bacterium]